MTIAHSKVTAQGQISVPAKVRRKLAIGPGSVLEWSEEGDQIVVRRAGRFSSGSARSSLCEGFQGALGSVAGGPESKHSEIPQEEACAPLTPMSWSACWHGTTSSRWLPPKNSSMGGLGVAGCSSGDHVGTVIGLRPRSEADSHGRRDAPSSPRPDGTGSRDSFSGVGDLPYSPWDRVFGLLGVGQRSSNGPSSPRNLRQGLRENQRGSEDLTRALEAFGKSAARHKYQLATLR